MAAPTARILLLLVSIAVSGSVARAQTVAPASTRAASAPVSGRATVAWTLKTRQDIRWQQVTAAGTWLISTDGALAGVDIDRGQVVWEKPELGGVPADSVRQSGALATKRFKASLAVPGSVFMLTKAPEGKGNVLLQVDKDSAQPKARVDLGKEREPVYAVDDIAGMLFLRTAPGTLVGYEL